MRTAAPVSVEALRRSESRAREVILTPAPPATTGVLLEVGSRSRAAVGSFQNYTGIDGIGSVTTSSPTSSMHLLCPPRERDTARQFPRRESPHATTARFGAAADERSAQRSVPADSGFDLGMPAPTDSVTSTEAFSGRGEPVEPTALSSYRVEVVTRAQACLETCHG